MNLTNAIFTTHWPRDLDVNLDPFGHLHLLITWRSFVENGQGILVVNPLTKICEWTDWQWGLLVYNLSIYVGGDVETDAALADHCARLQMILTVLKLVFTYLLILSTVLTMRVDQRFVQCQVSVSEGDKVINAKMCHMHGFQLD